MRQYKFLMFTGDRFKSKSIKVIICFLAVLMFVQCKPGTGKNTEGKLVVIDVTKNYPMKKLYLQDIAEVKYIPLETNDSTLLGLSFRRLYVSDDYIITINSNNKEDIFVFDGNGKSKFSFNHRGQGPTEYNYVKSLAFDEKAKEMFIFDMFTSTPRILVYAEDGKYKRTLTLIPELKEIEVYNYDDETLLVYDESDVLRYNEAEQGEYSHRPYMIISKADGSIIETLNTHLPVRITNATAWETEKDGQTMYYSTGIPITNNRSFGKDFIICDWSSDTIYRLTTERELQPIIARTPPMIDTDPKILLSTFLATDKFVLLGVYDMDYDKLKNGAELTAKQLMYDFETGEISRYRFVNRDITTSTSVRMWEARTPENTGVSLYNISLLFDLDAKEELTGDLKELMKSLDEDDNPVLMKIKFY